MGIFSEIRVKLKNYAKNFNKENSNCVFSCQLYQAYARWMYPRLPLVL